MFARTCSAAIIAACATAAAAQPVDNSFTYQGQLQEEFVNANGFYDINFALFEASTGGTARASDLIEGVQVTNGLFTVDVDFGPNVFIPGGERWVLIQIRSSDAGGAFQSLSPRQELTATPFADFANEADFAMTSGTDMQSAYDNGRSVFLSGTNAEGAIEFRRDADISRVVILDGPGFGGMAIAGSQPPNGSDAWALYSNVAQGSNALKVANTTTGADGLFYEGRDNESRLNINGGTSTFRIDTDAALEDDRLMAPASSISSIEQSNEAGVTATTNISTIFTPAPSPVEAFGSRTINAPAPGYVLVIATIEAQIAKSGGMISANFGVSDSPTSLPNNQDFELVIEASLPSGPYDQPVTVHGLFEVDAGSHTFYLLGDQTSTSGTISVFDGQLTCVYLPTAYGSVSPTERSANGSGNDDLASAGSLNAAQINAERLESIAANQARIEAENQAMRARIQSLESQLQGQPLNTVIREGRVEAR